MGCEGAAKFVGAKAYLGNISTCPAWVSAELSETVWGRYSTRDTFARLNAECLLYRQP